MTAIESTNQNGDSQFLKVGAQFVHHRQRPWASVTERLMRSRLKQGDAVPQSYSRYYGRDFERRWRKRLEAISKLLTRGDRP
jgi:hypothetical protein